MGEAGRDSGGTMNVHIISPFTSSARIKVFHYCMFHGEANPRIGHRFSSKVSTPLQLSRSGVGVPNFFSPSAVILVVAEEVKGKLESLPNIEFAEVEFAKLVDVPYQAGDFSYYRTSKFLADPIANDPEALIARLPDVPALHSNVGSYFEVIVPRLCDIVTKYPSLNTVEYRLRMAAVPEQVEICLSEALLKDHPVVWENDYVFSEEAFNIVDQYIDRDYYEIVTVNM
jgi:hypothetical protein